MFIDLSWLKASALFYLDEDQPHPVYAFCLQLCILLYQHPLIHQEVDCVRAPVVWPVGDA